MTLRMDFAWLAIAALGLIISDVSVARALSFCDVNPDRCRYSPSGKGYYYPRGRPMPQGLEPAFVERTGTGNAARTQAWGCGATDGKATGRSWGYRNKAAASYSALAACTQRSARASCHIVSCSSSVRNRDEAGVLLSLAHR